MNSDIEIYVKGTDIQFYQDEELIYETELTAQIPYAIEGLLSTLGYNVSVLDINEDDLLPDDCREPYYEEDPIDEIED